MAAFGLADLRQHLDAQIRREGDGDDPGHDQCNAHDPEHVAGVFAGRGTGKAVGHEAHRRHQRAGQHRRGSVAPGIGGGGNAAVAFLHLDHHHLDRDDGIVHQQSQRKDQRAQGNAVKVLASGRHDDEHCGQRQRHSRCHDNADAPAHAQETHRQHHQQGDKELDHELIDRCADVDGLVGHFGQAHAQRQRFIDS
ncbi:hypothetical protein D9M72_320090 [compost metagenome]